MEQYVREMVAAGIESVELQIRHAGNPGQGKPFMVPDVGKGPVDSLPAQSAADSGILGNINIIVVVDEFMVKRLAENGPDGHCQQQADCQAEPTLMRSGLRRESSAALAG